MDLHKSALTTTGQKVYFTVPFAKVDQERRLVSGFATLDNVDRQGDIVTTEASIKAFDNSRKNIREMHGNIAAGRIVNYSVESFYNPDDNKSYTGIFVSAYVSKGAESTWEKVLDGTLTGFSIGGQINDWDNVYDSDLEATIRVITDYELLELSLVDNPANPLANIFTVEKSGTGSFIKGMAADIHIENVFYCETDEFAQANTAEAIDCVACGDPMKNIGWFESTAERDQEIGDVVSKYRSSVQSEGGVQNMEEQAEFIEKSDDVAVVPEEEAAEVVEDEAVEEEAVESESEEFAHDVEKAVEVEAEAVNTDELDIEKALNEIKDSTEETVKAIQKSAHEQVEQIRVKIEEFQKSYDEKFAELDEKFSQIQENLSGYKDSSEQVAKRLDALESATAIRKSVEVESTGNETSEDGSVFKGVFLGLDRLS